MTNKRKRKQAAGTSSARGKRRRGQAPPPSPPPERADERVQNSLFNKKCKLSTLLQPNYRGYKNLFRQVAEDFSIARRDALNFGLLMIAQWFNTQHTELQDYQRRLVPPIQNSLRKLLHETSLINQLQNLIQRTDALFRESQLATPEYEDLTRRQEQIQEIITAVTPISQQMNDLLVHLNAEVTDEAQQNVEQQRNSSLNIHLLLLDLLPLFTDLKNVTADSVPVAERIQTELERQLQNSIDATHVNNRESLVNVRNAMELQIKLTTLEQKHQTIIAQGPLTTSDTIRLQTIRRTQIAILTARTALNRMREREQQDRAFLDGDAVAREYVANVQLLLTVIDISDNYKKLFQNIEIAVQQIRLALKDPEFNFTFPSVTNDTFWSHMYCKVCADPNNLNRHITFNRAIDLYFDDFDISRKHPGTNNYIYDLPVLDTLQKSISFNYNSTVVQNVVMHLLNTNVWIIRLFKAFLIFHQAQNNVQVAVTTLAKNAATAILNHHEFDRLPNVENIPGFRNLFDRIRVIYDGDFQNTEPDEMNDYDNAKNHPMKYLRVSYRLLQEAESHEEWQVKLWSLLPGASHGIAHAPISDYRAMYGVFVKARLLNLHIPAFLLDRHGELITVTEFMDLYSCANDRQRIWQWIFDIDKLQRNRLQDLQENDGVLDPANADERVKLGFGLKTDGHMISVLFERASHGIVLPTTTKDIKLLRRNLDLANVDKGIYPLYKTPIGITEDDRIIGIDPGVRDIICAVDCAPEDLTDKQTTRQHSFSVSNRSYKIRSGMQWINQRELQNRQHESMQEVYDRLSSRKVSTNEAIMNFLYSTTEEHERMFNFMKAYRHRENKGYNFSNRQRAQDHVARIVVGTTTKQEPYKLSHTSCSRLQRKGRRVFRGTLDHLRQDQRRTVVAYGDASIRSTYRGNTPVPVKAIQRAIATKALVTTVDEFRTSITCCHCLQRLEVVPQGQNLQCNHRKKKHRSNGQEGHANDQRAFMKCFDEEGHVLHRTSACPDRAPVPQQRPIYALKLCPQCPVGNNDNALHWNRDVNAAANIRSILWRYITQGYNLDSRPEELSRRRQGDEYNEET